MSRHTKKQNQRFHARNRAMERYGISYNAQVRKILLEMISNNKTTVIERQSLRLSIREATLSDVLVRFVYDNIRKEIVTFLPLGETIDGR